ncbi:hypothetical protein [Chimaeribacter californicus]|uniref:hypothetical protein n=1 Tax=Chimaeribacter californicus TaxID=2060067 RepID=UPI0011AEC3C2|nr:hypothetical protein [Chimaeribacter californicus]
MIDRSTRRGSKSQTERAGRTLTARPALSVFSELSNNTGIALLSRLLSPCNAPARYYLHRFNRYFIKKITVIKNSLYKQATAFFIYPWPPDFLFKGGSYP